MTKIASVQSLHEWVWVSPDRLSGEPCFRGTRVPVALLFEYLEAGESLDEFLNGFPSVRREQAVGVLEWAAQRLREALDEASVVG
jgi:uncharacterized protein (DUF433 family)